MNLKNITWNRFIISFLLITNIITVFKMYEFAWISRMDHSMIVCYNAEANNYPFANFRCTYVPRGAGW